MQVRHSPARQDLKEERNQLCGLGRKVLWMEDTAGEGTEPPRGGSESSLFWEQEGGWRGWR